MPPYKVWWKKSPKPGNFGDILTPEILKYFKIPFEYSQDYNLISIGSIAKKAKAGTVICGSGMLSSIENLNIHADWRFVRGPLTRNRIIELGGTCPEIYGDAALLLPLLVDESKKMGDVVIIPHYSDYQIVKTLYPTLPRINLLNSDPLSVAKTITRFRQVISSSLHGIICAHAFGIPAAWVEFSNNLKGSNFKFYDYFASVAVKPKLSTMKNLKFTHGTVNIKPMIEIFQSL